MAYDISNLSNVTNYLAQQRQSGAYVPTNGSMNTPSQGWDGWAGYNPQTRYQRMPTGGPLNQGGGLGHIVNQTKPQKSVKPQGPGFQQTNNSIGNGQNTMPNIPTRPTGTGAYTLQNNQWVANPNVTQSPAQPLSQTLQNVQNYGNQYGQNAYYFQQGINDPQTKMQHAQQMADMLNGQGNMNNGTAWDMDSILKLQNPNQGVDYWNNVWNQYQAGQHPLQP